MRVETSRVATAARLLATIAERLVAIVVVATAVAVAAGVLGLLRGLGRMAGGAP